MANDGNQSFLYRLKLMFDGGDAVVQMQEQMRGVEERVKSLNEGVVRSEQALEGTSSAAEKVQDSLDDIQFSRAPRGISKMQQDILQSDSALEELAAEGTRTWGSINQGALQASEGAEKLSKQLVRTKNAQEQLSQASQGYEDKTKKTTQTSQNLLRILQDSQFGMMGMANNFQALAESMGRAGTRGKTAFEQLMGGLKNLLLGPMALPAAVTAATLLVQVDWESVPEKIDSWVASLGRFINEVTDARRQVNNLKDATDELLEIDEEDSTSDFMEQLEAIGSEGGEKAEELFQQFKVDAQAAEHQIQSLNEEFNRIGNPDIRKTVKQDDLSTIKDWADGASEEFEEALQGGNYSALPYLVGGVGPRDELSRIEQHIRKFGDEAEAAQKKMRALRAEEIKMDKRVEAINEKTGARKETIRDVLEYEKQNSDEKKKQNDKINEQRRLRELQIEAMEEGLNKQIEGIDLRISRRRDEIRLMVQQEKISARIGQQMIATLEEIQDRQEEAAFSEVATLDFKFSREEGADERIAQIQEKYEENRQEILDTAGLEPSEREQALEDLKGDRDAAIAEVNENALFIPGQGMVLKNAFIKDQRQKLQEARKAQQRQIQDARFRAERGRVGESLFGGEIVNAQMEQQRKLIDQEKEARVERLEAEKDFQFNRFLAGEIGHEKYLENVKRKEDQITQVQENAARERVRLVNEQYRQIANSVNSSPVGDAVSGLIGDLGGIWKGFHEDQFNWQEKSMKERATLVGQMGGQIAGRMSSIAEASFKSWKSERKQDLKDQGKTAEERKKILEEEGKSRFHTVKAMKITEASINTATAATQALSQLPFPANYAAAAAVTAAGVAKVKKIASMDIGDKISRSGGQSSGIAGGEYTQLGAATAANAAQRAGTNMRRRSRSANQRDDEDSTKKIAREVGREVANQMPDEVTMDRGVAEDANDAAVSQKDKLNK